MSTESEIVTVRGEGISLSLLVWRFLKRKPEGYVESVLAANPGLAGLGAILPVGTKVRLPLDYADAGDAGEAPAVISLWD
jgi:phage tail protein X